MWQGLLVLSFFAYNGYARPSTYDDYLTVNDDIATVESLRRDVREPAPLGYATEVKDLLSAGNTPNKSPDVKKRMKNASGKSDEGGYYKMYGSDAEGEKGYLKETYGKGDHGYKTLDTFHKQNGDKYGFERHISYGKARSDKGNGHHANAGSHSKKNDDHEGAGTIVGAHYTGTEGDHDGGGEYSHYIESGDGTHYADGYNGHSGEKSPVSSSYAHSESYSVGKDGDGSYETHSSYSSDKDEGEDGH